MKHPRLPFIVALAVAPAFTGFDCTGAEAPAPSVADETRWSAGNVVVVVRSSPFALRLEDKGGKLLAESAEVAPAGEPSDVSRAYGAIGLTHDTDKSIHGLMVGWNYFRGDDDPWHRSTHVTRVSSTPDALHVTVATDDTVGRSIELAAVPRGGGVELTVVADAGAAPSEINRVSLAFAMHDDDHFLGMGERFVRSDHRGQHLYSWVEDGGLGHGEDTPPSASNPSPSGEGQTNLPIPWFMSPRGFAILAGGTRRLNHHLGDEVTQAWRIESTSNVLDLTVFADPDPLALVAELTAITGRPPEIADWVLAPRRRANPGSPELDRLRQNHVATSVIDTAVHYFPSGPPKELEGAPMKALTADLHRRGFKAIAYFNPFVADSWHPVFDDAAKNGYLVKNPDGEPYVVLDPPYNAAMVDFTNPAAVAWYQEQLRGAIDDGWDGWMYDFAEYVPQDAVFFNGMDGMEAHNLYPVLYQRAAFDLLERIKKKDYLVFVRSGFVGTAGLVPMVWAGDQSTDFDRADGLPAALAGALNAGMSGIPLWGSDISGFHFLFNPPPDKELYLRWTELGAFSADMHDENEGVGGGPSGDRWQIWKDEDSIDVYRTYASLKTRMLPYVRMAVRQARERGTPVMRHLYLAHPADPKVITVDDEYLYGDALLVAPVVARGQTSRNVYLPGGPGSAASYFDFWTGARTTAGSDVTVAAPLETVPVFGLMGGIVPMLAPDVETVVASTDGSVVSMDDRRDELDIRVFAGGSSEVTLDDGTVVSQSAPTAPFSALPVTASAGPIRAAVSAAELATCDACAWDDAAAHATTIVVTSKEDTIAAGAMTLRVRGVQVKRYVFTVTH